MANKKISKNGIPMLHSKYLRRSSAIVRFCRLPRLVVLTILLRNINHFANRFVVFLSKKTIPLIFNSLKNKFWQLCLFFYFCSGELAEWSNAAVLKTVNCHRFGGSNPSLSATQNKTPQ